MTTRLVSLIHSWLRKTKFLIQRLRMLWKPWKMMSTRSKWTPYNLFKIRQTCFCTFWYISSITFLKGEMLRLEWKTAYIFNPHKKGSRKILSNYWRVSVTNSISRIDVYRNLSEQELKANMIILRNGMGFMQANLV